MHSSEFAPSCTFCGVGFHFHVYALMLTVQSPALKENLLNRAMILSSLGVSLDQSTRRGRNCLLLLCRKHPSIDELFKHFYIFLVQKLIEEMYDEMKHKQIIMNSL